MNAIRCPRCLIQEQIYKAPLGKVVRNPEALANGVVHDDCKACNGTGYVPTAVIDSIVTFARTDERAKEILSQLRWSYDHYSFMAGTLYVGVEVDGHLHS